jgi:NSS family neurotransmitter:Na+ symporter
MIEPITTGINKKWKISKAKATGLICTLGFFSSLIFATGSGLHWLDIVDHFIANFGLVTIGLVECLILGWMFQLYKLREHANKTSEILIGRWWDFFIKFAIPFVLFLLLAVAIANNILEPYLGYPWWIITLGGIIPCLSIFLLSIILMKIKYKKVT